MKITRDVRDYRAKDGIADETAALAQPQGKGGGVQKERRRDRPSRLPSTAKAPRIFPETGTFFC